MKAYILTEKDFEALLFKLEIDPKRRNVGGSGRELTEVERSAFDDANRFYNYHIRCWIDEVKKWVKKL